MKLTMNQRMAAGVLSALALGAALAPARGLAADVTADNLTVRGKLEVAPGAPVPAPTNGLMLYYTFDSWDGSTVADQSGLGKTGQVYGPTFVSNGLSGGAYRFDGADDYICTLDAFDPSAYTISLWVRLDDLERRSFITRTAQWGGVYNSTDQLGIARTNEFEYFVWPSCYPECRVFASGPASTGVWYHVAGTAEDNGTMRLYVNGVEVGSTTLQNVLWREGDRWHIGSQVGYDYVFDYGPYYGYRGYFRGLMDELRLYNRVLSADEIRTLYTRNRPDAGEVRFAEGLKYTKPLGDIPVGSFTNRPPSPPTADDFVVDNLNVQGRLEVARAPAAPASTNGLVLHYSFDTANGSTVLDQSGLGHTGTLYGASWTAGAYSTGAYDFDGADDKLVVPHRADLSPVSAISLSTWVKLDSIGPDGADMLAFKENVFFLYAWENGSQKRIEFDVINGAGPYVSMDLPAGQWAHVAATYDGTNARVFVNGQSASTYGAGSLQTSPYSLVFGCYQDPGLSYQGYFWNGLIDEFRFYTRALSSNEVWNLYQLNRPLGAGEAEVRFGDGVRYMKPIGDIPTGTYTNGL